jgi:hypothetical protein
LPPKGGIFISEHLNLFTKFKLAAMN